MSKLADKIKQFLNGFFNISINENKDFFSKSNALNLLKIASLASLTVLLNKTLSKIKDETDNIQADIQSEDDVETYVKNNRDLQKITKAADKSLSDEAVSDIVLACEDPVYYEEKAKNLQGNLSKVDGNLSENDFLRIAEAESNFDSRVDSTNLNQIESVLNNIKGYLPYAALGFIITLKVKEFLEQNEFPSTFRAKYLQKQIRFTSAILKRQANSARPEYANKFKDLLSTLKSLDFIIAASVMATFVYLNNRKLYQKASEETIKEINKSFACSETESALSDEETSIEFDPSSLTLESSLNLNGFSCPVEVQEPIVPHESFEDKLKNNRLAACEIIQNEETPEQIDAEFKSDTADKALIENDSDQNMSILVKPSYKVTSKTLLGTLGGSNLYSPVDGIVSKIEKNKIYIKDIQDPNNSFLEEQITTLQDLYKEFNDTKLFLKDYYIKSIYPVMLANSPLIDEELTQEEYDKIQYFDGMEQIFKTIANDYEDLFNSYESNIQKITGEKNVKEKSENEQLLKLKKEIDNEENSFYKALKALGGVAINKAVVTLPKEDEFVLIEYYFELYQDVLSLWEQTEVSIPFRNQLNSILIERFFVDGWSLTKLKDRVNSLCEDLAEDTFFEETPNFFKIMLSKYKNHKKLKDVKDYVSDLAKENTEFTEEEKQKIIDKIMFVFNFALEVIERVADDYESDLNKYEITAKEANFIQNYFDILWKRYKNIPKEIEDIYSKLDDIGNTLITYTIKEIDGEEYRYYGIGEGRTCPLEEDNEGYTSPYSEYEFKDIQYWLKYCSFATLASVTNPAQGWSTGVPPPIGPITLPVIYIPIKAFQLNWGFIVIGITVCGMYPFPWVLFSNLDMLYHVPIGDPTTIIKQEIQGLKKALSKNLKDFKNVTLRGFLTDKKNKIDIKNEEIDELEEEKRINKLEKPKKKRVDDDGNPIDDSDNYTKQLLAWDADRKSIQLKLSTAKTQRFILEKEYQVVYRVYSGSKLEGDPVDPKIISIQKTEEGLDKQFKALDKLAESIEKIIKPLPITTKPASANFALTIKNPKPIINFGEDLDNNTNTNALNPIVEKFKVKKEDFMNSNFVSKLPKSFTDFEEYKSTLKGAMPIIIKGDPFPKYENLKLTNVPWILFLYLEWVPIGAQTYGFPVFSPLPTG